MTTTECLPRTDITEQDAHYTIRLEVAGVTKDSLTLDLDDGTLTIRATRSPLPEGFRPLKREVHAETYTRSFSIGDQIDRERIVADLGDGILEITLPKATAALPKAIPIQSRD